MKRFLCITFGFLPLIVAAQRPMKLWYKQPAKVWTEALPLGNGRLGAMVFGGVANEHLQLNESTFWTGGPIKSNVNPESPKYLAQVRDALLNKHDYKEASRLTKKMQGLFTESYLPLADIFIKQQLKDTNATKYYRDLDITTAIANTNFTADGVNYHREAFSSSPDQVMVLRLTADKPGKLNFTVNSSSLVHFTLLKEGSGELRLSGKAPVHADPSYYNPKRDHIVYQDTAKSAGMRYELLIKAINDGGTVETSNNGIVVKNATKVTLLLSAATSFNGFDHNQDKDEHRIAREYLNKAAAKGYESLRKAHISDYQKYFNRVSLNIAPGKPTPNAVLPTDERINGYTAGAYDPDYETLYFQYGRYLLISSSRPGGTAANLQGIWNNEMRPPWSSNYTININTQMNYWPAESTNLSEMHQPLFGLIKELAITGKTTAKQFYNANGWVAHHNSDIWAQSNPVGDVGNGDPKWANWAMGGNWLCQHLWEHYQFTRDRDFLQKQAYPIMKEAALFCFDWLVEDKDGYLVTAPSVSPENDYIDDEGRQGEVSVATTMDMSIIYDLFTNLIDASEQLGNDAGFRKLLIEKRNKLYPLHIGKAGNLQEWYKDFKDVDPHHRHVSHLFGLYPGKQISPIATPEFAKAALKTLEIRGDDGTGWSLAWKLNFWARLLNGNHAYQLIRELLKSNSAAQTDIHHGGGVYPNMFDSHPPFQIDGNFGGTAGMTEMLLQSQLGDIYMLPALPDAWETGTVRGLKARGNFQVDMIWVRKKLQSATILSLKGGICKVRTSGKINVKGVATKVEKTDFDYVTSFETRPGVKYSITAVN
ncbi:glycoside hydrolase family 95 protein [Mucilaginibacter terrenus]|uniref:Glycoside hydrolase family 95 protein n=1 Tax=Mucilaginibacter terrenus TaxID=2482727 RepID=A0A3E2NTF6_9SPHI|nr:glycoside hydrolase family 95 protein [Mucilaginibacter terrenus]RFZ84140.1 glycoside hydrolase family 95 protein [Mucilaginibacter terrenus]